MNSLAPVLSALGVAMPKPTSWAWVAGVALIGVGGVLALARSGQPPAVTKPAPPAKAIADSEWIPKLDKDGKIDPKSKAPTAFPDLWPEADPDDPVGFDQREAAFAKLCPRLTAATVLKIEVGDDTLRKLLKARLHRGVLEIMRYREVMAVGRFDTTSFASVVECLTDMQAVATELWGGRPKELVPWLEELVVQAKEFERFVGHRVRLGGAPASNFDAAVRHRLRVEAALSKANGGK